jgi:hypothetical protein
MMNMIRLGMLPLLLAVCGASPTHSGSDRERLIGALASGFDSRAGWEAGRLVIRPDRRHY